MLNVMPNLGWKSKIAAIAAILMTSLPSYAVPIDPGDGILETFDIDAGGSAAFDFEPTSPLRVSIVSIGASGFVDSADLAMVLFGVNGADTSFTMFTDNGPTSSAEGALPSFFATDPFTINFNAAGTTEEVGATFTFVTSEVEEALPVVPLPASGLMLGGLMLLGLGGAAARRYFS